METKSEETKTEEKKVVEKLMINITFDTTTGELGLQHNLANPVMALGMLAMAEKMFGGPRPQAPAIQVASQMPSVLPPGGKA